MDFTYKSTPVTYFAFKLLRESWIKAAGNFSLRSRNCCKVVAIGRRPFDWIACIVLVAAGGDFSVGGGEAAPLLRGRCAAAATPPHRRRRKGINLSESVHLTLRKVRLLLWCQRDSINPQPSASHNGLQPKQLF